MNIARTNAELAEALGVTATETIRRLIRKRVIAPLEGSSISGNLFDIDDCVTKYAEYKIRISKEHFNGLKW